MAFVTEVSYETGMDWYGAIRSTTDYTAFAQSFKVGVSNIDVTRTVVEAYRIGTGGTCWTEIRLASNNSLIATSTVRNLSTLDTAVVWENFDFSSPVTLTAATIYYLAFCGDQTIGGGNYPCWGADSTSPSYTDGSFFSWNGSIWTAATGLDLLFKIQSGSADTSTSTTTSSSTSTSTTSTSISTTSISTSTTSTITSTSTTTISTSSTSISTTSTSSSTSTTSTSTTTIYFEPEVMEIYDITGEVSS